MPIIISFYFAVRLGIRKEKTVFVDFQKHVPLNFYHMAKCVHINQHLITKCEGWSTLHKECMCFVVFTTMESLLNQQTLQCDHINTFSKTCTCKSRAFCERIKIDVSDQMSSSQHHTIIREPEIRQTSYETISFPLGPPVIFGKLTYLYCPSKHVSRALSRTACSQDTV